MLRNKIKLHLTVTFLLTATIFQFLSFIYKMNITSHRYQLPLIGYSPAWLIKPMPLFPLRTTRIPMIHGNRKWCNLAILSFHFHYPLPVSSVPAPFSAACFYSSFGAVRFSPFYFLFSFFYQLTTSFRSIVALPPKRRKIDGTTNWFCQSCRGDSHVDGLCRLKRKGAAQQRWKNVETTKHGPRRPERFVTGIQRSGRATFITVACFFLVGSFVRFSIFFPFSSAFFSLVLSSVFLSFSISSAPVLVHNIRTRLDASTPRRDVSREQQTDIHPGTKREILFPLAETCNRRTISHRLNRDLFLSTVLFVRYTGCLTVQPFVYDSEISNFIKPVMSSLEFFSAYLAYPFVCFLILWIFFFSGNQTFVLWLFYDNHKNRRSGCTSFIVRTERELKLQTMNYFSWWCKRFYK